MYCLLNVMLTAFCYVRERDSFMVTLPKLVRALGHFVCVDQAGMQAHAPIRMTYGCA